MHLQISLRERASQSECWRERQRERVVSSARLRAVTVPRPPSGFSLSKEGCGSVSVIL